MTVKGKVTKYFACAVTEDDLTIFAIERGSCNGQQTLEALAILVALRLWYHPDDAKRLNLSVRGDNVGSLTLLLKMRPSSSSQAIVARELALLTARAAFPPRVVHTPGIAHKLADLLSRVHDPHKSVRLEDLHLLVQAERAQCPPRPRAYYTTLEDATPLRKLER
jgi:CRP-like cAMP-binding protein